MTGRFDLAALLAASELVRDDHGRIELRFRYPASGTGEPVLRRVVRPALLHTAADGWVVRGIDLARGRVRTFTCSRILAVPAPRAYHATTGDADAPREAPSSPPAAMRPPALPVSLPAPTAHHEEH